MGRLRTIWLTVVSEISWRIPNRQALFLAQFSQAERGSAYDMLAAAELTETRSLRRKYLEHALDEARHSRIFRERAIDLGVDADNAALMDAGYLDLKASAWSTWEQMKKQKNRSMEKQSGSEATTPAVPARRTN